MRNGMQSNLYGMPYLTLYLHKIMEEREFFVSILKFASCIIQGYMNGV